MAGSSRPISGETERIARILVVDDEALICRSLRLVLSDEFDVSTTTDPAEALSWLVSGDRYDVVLCDLTMPVMTGIELFDRVRAVDLELAERFVFVTGGILHADVRNTVDGIRNVVLPKPFDFPALRHCIRDMVRRMPPPGAASQR